MPGESCVWVCVFCVYVCVCLCARERDEKIIYSITRGNRRKELAQVKRIVIEAHKETEMRLLAIYYGLHLPVGQHTHDTYAHRYTYPYRHTPIHRWWLIIQQTSGCKSPGNNFICKPKDNTRPCVTAKGYLCVCVCACVCVAFVCVQVAKSTKW